MAMTDRLERRDTEEKRSKCVVCGFELTYPEYITNNRCIFHSDFKIQWSLFQWLRFAYAEYRVMRLKLNYKQRGLNEKDYIACMGQNEDIGSIKDFKGMDKLCRELKSYRVAKT